VIPVRGSHVGAGPAGCGSHLKAFLKERRSRISASSVGLPSRSRRSGLRREDVAELLGVSPLWYALFESGTSRRRFSASFLQRVGEILRLNEDECETLKRLVLASGTAARDVRQLHADERSLRVMSEIAEVSHRLARAATGTEAVALAVNALRKVFCSALPCFTIAKDQRAVDDPAWLRAAFSSAQSVLFVSLSDPKTSYGVVCIGSPIPNAFSQVEEGIAEIVGTQLTRALSRTRLHANIYSAVNYAPDASGSMLCP